MQSIQVEEKLLLKLAQFRLFIDNEENKIDKKTMDLLLQGVDLNYKFSNKIILEKINGDVLGGVLLHFAYEKRNVDMFNALIVRGANFSSIDKNGLTVLHKCFKNFASLSESMNYNNKKHLSELIDIERCFIRIIFSAHMKQCNTSNLSDPDGITHFHVACTGPNIGIVNFFLRNGVSVNDTVMSNSFKGYSPLHFAVQYFCPKIVNILLQHGANVNLKNNKGMPPLQMSVERNIIQIDSNSSFDEIIEKNEAVMNLLLESSVNAEFPHLFVVSAMKNSNPVEKLLAQGVNVNQCIPTDSKIWPGYTALHFAAHVNVDTVKLLMKNGGNILARKANRITPFDMCMERYKVKDIVDIINLVPRWKDILMSDGKTKLIDVLLAFKDLDAIKYFLQKSKDNVKLFVPCNTPIWPGYTILHIAVIFSERIKCKFDYEKKENSISFKPNLNIINECLRQAADVTVPDKFLNQRNWTPIHLAFLFRKWNVAFLLLQYHRRLKSCVDNENLSHLHIACALGDQALVEKFLWNDVDVNVVYNGKSLPLLHPGWTPLHVAVSKGHCEIVKLLLDFGGNRHARDRLNFTPIHLLISHRHHLSLKIGKILLSLTDLQEYSVENLGLTYLHIACWTKNVDAVKKLLDHGVNVNKALASSKITSVETHSGCTALHFTLTNTFPSTSQKINLVNLEIVRMLIQRDANILIKNAAGISPLTLILESEDHLLCVDVIIEILKNNHDLRRRIEEEMGLTLLHLACRRSDFDLIKELVDSGFKVNAKINEDSTVWPGYTPLHILTCFFDHFKKDTGIDTIVKFLLHRNADVTLSHSKRSTPLHIVHRSFCIDSVWQHFNLLNLLLKYHKNYQVNPTTDDGISHFHIACHILNIEVVKKFLEHDVNVNATIDITSSASHLAACSPLLLAIKTNLSQLGWTIEINEPFLQFEVIDLLMKHGANVHVEDLFRNTPLHYAATRDLQREHIAQSLVKGGADPNPRNLQGDTPLGLLLNNARMKAAEIHHFISLGCHLNMFNFLTEAGYIATASTKLTYNEMQSLLYGSFVNFPQLMKEDDTKRTAIHNIVSVSASECDDKDYFDLFELCEKFGCDIDDQDYLGRTALHLAALFRNENAIAGLLLSGADVNVTDCNGKTPFAYIFKSCTRCSDVGKDHNRDSHFKLFNMFAIEIRKYITYGLDVNDSNYILLNKAYERFEPDNVSQGLDSALETDREAMKLKIEHYEISLRDFVHGSAVIDYPMMSFAKREAIDELFRTKRYFFYLDLKKSCGLMYLQYRKAILRRKIIYAAEDSLSVLIKFRLPVICSQIILRFLNNYELQNMISSTA